MRLEAAVTIVLLQLLLCGEARAVCSQNFTTETITDDCSTHDGPRCLVHGTGGVQELESPDPK